MKISIIGAGNMGRAIGTRAIAGGREVEIVDNDPADANALADELGASHNQAPALSEGRRPGPVRAPGAAQSGHEQHACSR